MREFAIKMCKSGKIDMSDEMKYTDDKHDAHYITKIFNVVNGCDKRNDEVVHTYQSADITNVNEASQTVEESVKEVQTVEEIIQEVQTGENVVKEVVEEVQNV